MHSPSSHAFHSSRKCRSFASFFLPVHLACHTIVLVCSICGRMCSESYNAGQIVRFDPYVPYPPRLLSPVCSCVRACVCDPVLRNASAQTAAHANDLRRMAKHRSEQSVRVPGVENRVFFPETTRGPAGQTKGKGHRRVDLDSGQGGAIVPLEDLHHTFQKAEGFFRENRRRSACSIDCCEVRPCPYHSSRNGICKQEQFVHGWKRKKIKT